jgi:hydrogenase assembly chaperone HypC/HupF
MCLTIPKKVIEITREGVLVENHKGDRQILKTMVDLSIGDYVFSQQNIIIEKMDQETAQEILNLIKNNNEGV